MQTEKQPADEIAELRERIDQLEKLVLRAKQLSEAALGGVVSLGVLIILLALAVRR